MIFIDLSNFSPNDVWIKEALQINAELLSKNTLAEKYQYIHDNRAFWGKIKSEFPQNDKCWFSEAKESVSLYEIEHFRPTKAVGRSTGVRRKLKLFDEENRIHWTKENKFRADGYWWLAFNYKNFRNCGKRVNMSKGIRFPIKIGSVIAYSEEDDLTLETEILLDPTKLGDPDLLTFDPDGTAKPSKIDDKDFDFIRAFVSIEIFGLNSIESLVKHRQSKWKECYKAIDRAKNKFNQVEEAAQNDDLDNYNILFNEFMDFVDNDIKPAIKPTSEFSAVAKACVLSYSNYSWIHDYVLNP